MTEDETVSGTLDVQLQLATSAVPGPDGQPWVLLSFQYGLTKLDLLLPAELAVQAGPVIAAKLDEASAAARRARLGIILPGDQVPTASPPGGRVPLPRLPGVAG